MKIKLIVGLMMLCSLIVKGQNTVTGTGASTAGSGNSIYGYYAGDLNTGTANSFIGHYSGKNNVDGYHNSFFGYYSGNSNTSGYQNTFIGKDAGTENTTGNNNAFLGVYSGWHNTAGASNAFFGNNSGANNSTGNYNTFIGSSAGSNSTSGTYNISIGYLAGSSRTGNNNLFIGYLSGNGNNGGINNVMIGSKSGYSNVTGTNNVFLGYNAGYNETSSNKLYIDNSNTTTPLIYGDFSTNQVGINALPSTYTLNVGGTMNATAIYVNDVLMSGDMSLWHRTGNNVFTVSTTDNIGIGVTLATNPNNYKLGVKGKIGAQEVQIENNSLTWSDFVFYDDYKLPSLEQVEEYIKTNKHLSDIPSAEQVKEEGIKVSEMNAKLLQKIEELTLYVIELKKDGDALKKEVEHLKKNQK
jgi:trimeric autotransporter adhesin